LKVRDVIRLLEANGWKLKRTTGSHRQFEHASSRMVITVAGKQGEDLPIGMKAILKTARLIN
jgi:predicted RNA binding protein YcfA (HicA-like mRNA interferase family)